MPNSPEEIALDAFRKPYNCAQTVWFAMKGNSDEQTLQELKSCGGGRAEGGLCGALHAARLIAGDAKKDEVEEFFKAKIGATTCAAIKGECKVSCENCVRTAIRAL